jgi:hypothetical protein
VKQKKKRQDQQANNQSLTQSSAGAFSDLFEAKG